MVQDITPQNVRPIPEISKETDGLRRPSDLVQANQENFKVPWSDPT